MKFILGHQSLQQGLRDGWMGFTFTTAWLWDKIQEKDWKSSRCSVEASYSYKARLKNHVVLPSDKYVNFIIETRSQSIDIDEIRHETLMDDTLNLVIKALKDISWSKNSPSLHPFSKISQKLSAWKTNFIFINVHIDGLNKYGWIEETKITTKF